MWGDKTSGHVTSAWQGKGDTRHILVLLLASLKSPLIMLLLLSNTYVCWCVMNQQGFRSIVSSSCQYHTSLIFMDLFYKDCCLPVLLNIVTCARLWIITYERKKDRLIWSQRKASPLPAYFRTAESKLWAEGCLSESMSSSQQGSWCTSVLHFCYSSVPIMLTFTLPIEKEPTVIQLVCVGISIMLYHPVYFFPVAINNI